MRKAMLFLVIPLIILLRAFTFVENNSPAMVNGNGDKPSPNMIEYKITPVAGNHVKLLIST